MLDNAQLQRLHDKWSADILGKIAKANVSEGERLRLYIEAEKVSLLSQIAQGISLYHETQ
jgi:ABC-type molybdate transport system ATPase subunit